MKKDEDTDEKKQQTPEAEGGFDWEESIENVFESVGHTVGKYPWYFIAGSLIVTVLFGMGFSVLKSESRPDKQWVPDGSVSLEHTAYVGQTWPSQQRWSFWTATCKDKSTADCNILEAKYIKRLQEKHNAIKKIVTDGDALVKELDEKYPKFPDEYPRSWAKYAGKWSFDGTDGTGTGVRANKKYKQKCFKFGPFCAWESVLDLFNQNETAVMALTDASAIEQLNSWFREVPKKYGCYDLDGSINGKKHTCDCKANVCTPEKCGAVKGIFTEDCQSCSCVNYTKAHAGLTRFPQRPAPTSIASVDKVAGGLTRNSAGNVTAAKALFGFYVLSKDDTFFVKEGSSKEPLAQKWEQQALCVLGIDTEASGGRSDACPRDDLLDFQPQFSRSLSDEFGGAIKGDVAALGIAYTLMLAYLFVMLSRFDTVHSMVGMSFVAVLICGMSYGCCFGLCGMLNWMGMNLFNNNLNGNIPFLLLGLGIDDAFVLSSEYARACKLRPADSIEQRISTALRHGGLSIFMTSLTDALAFLIGSNTSLPALRWFCIFAGIGVIFCFLFQVFFFMPCLAINARRAEANRYDVLCCVKSSEEHDLDKPQGCCGLCCTNWEPGVLARFLEGTFGPFIVSLPGMVFTGVVFGALTVTSIVGVCLIYKDFKIEWFLPDDSYVKEFVAVNDVYFSQGTPVTVYTRELDACSMASQQQLDALDHYLLDSKLIDGTQQVNNWFRDFHHYSAGAHASLVDSKGYYKDRAQCYAKLHDWFASFHGSMYRSSMKWKDARCQTGTFNNQTLGMKYDAKCEMSQGLAATRMQATLALGPSADGTVRYDFMTALRTDVARLLPGAFPYSFEFNWWEEVGVIGGELAKNLLICGTVVALVVFAMIPRPRIAGLVILCIMLSVMDVVGLLYFWGVTICGVSTIYILICVGLAVDYAAHVAHMFKASTGTSQQRALKALGRIGPCVFNAVVSTFLAVLVIGFSKSYIFRVFFKAFFLCVVVAGAHGLWLLPLLLSLLGGDNLGDGEDEEALGDMELQDKDAEASEEAVLPGVQVMDKGGDDAEVTDK